MGGVKDEISKMRRNRRTENTTRVLRGGNAGKRKQAQSMCARWGKNPPTLAVPVLAAETEGTRAEGPWGAKNLHMEPGYGRPGASGSRRPVRARCRARGCYRKTGSEEIKETRKAGERNCAHIDCKTEYEKQAWKKGNLAGVSNMWAGVKMCGQNIQQAG